MYLEDSFIATKDNSLTTVGREPKQERHKVEYIELNFVVLGREREREERGRERGREGRKTSAV